MIVGGGVAAANVARAFRDAGGEAPVSILSADTDPPYNRPPLSKGFLRGELEADAVFVEPESRYAELGIDLRLGCEVTAVRPAEQRVELADGGSLAYDRLVLASGSLPRALGTPGETLDGVHTYRTLRDAKAVRAAAESASSALVIGGGFIGMETTASLRRRGLAVTQIDRSDGLYASLQAPALSRSLERLYRERGVEVDPRRRGGRVPRQRGQAHGRRHARRGERSRPEISIVGVGVQPSTRCLEGSGIELEEGTVVVDERFASSVPGIWAVGDVANFHDPIFGHRRLIQHWTNASHQGQRLGRLLAGEDTPTTRWRTSSRRSSAPSSACSAISTAATTS